MDSRVTIGMAVHDDFDGAVFTIKNLQIYHDDHVKQIIIIDNNPDSYQGRTLKDFCKQFPSEKLIYVALVGVKGTAIPRNMVFENAKDGVVLCCDSHVVFYPDAIKSLRDYFVSHPDSQDLIQGPLVYDNGITISTHFDLSIWDGQMWGQWRTDNRYKEGKPFEIEAQGLGVFACRKESWLGFNPEFRGFGGEEGYIHIKYRQKGHKTLCLPQLLWWHRFARPNGVTYPLNLFDKVRNYQIGFKELGLDLKPAYDYFVGNKHLTEQDWESLLNGTYNPNTAAAGCSSCGGVVPIEQAYEKAKIIVSDINEHIQTLKELAEKSEVVVEFGVRTGVSTAGLLAGKPKLMLSYDVNESQHARNLASAAKQEGLKFEFYVGDSTQVDIPECDLLFIDTKHTADHCIKELNKHYTKVRKWIVLHDTEIFGERGEDSSPGLRHAIRNFLHQHPEWFTLKHYNNNNGLTVLSKLPEEAPPRLPPMWKMAGNFFKSTFKDLANGMARVPLEVAEERYKICTSNGGTCPLGQRRIDDDRCAACGCYLKTENNNVTPKIYRPMDACPLGLWGNYHPDEIDPKME